MEGHDTSDLGHRAALGTVHFGDVQHAHGGDSASDLNNWSALADDFQTFLLNAGIFELTLAAV